MELLDLVCGKFHEEAGIFKLLIVDSIMALFRVDFSGRGELADRQQQLAQMLSKLQKISEVTETSTDDMKEKYQYQKITQIVYFCYCWYKM